MFVAIAWAGWIVGKIGHPIPDIPVRRSVPSRKCFAPTATCPDMAENEDEHALGVAEGSLSPVVIYATLFLIALFLLGAIYRLLLVLV